MDSTRNQPGELEETQSGQMSPGDPRGPLGGLTGDTEHSRNWEEHLAEQIRRFGEITRPGTVWAEDLEGAGERPEGGAQSVISSEPEWRLERPNTWRPSGPDEQYRGPPPSYPGYYPPVDNYGRGEAHRANSVQSEPGGAGRARPYSAAERRSFLGGRGAWGLSRENLERPDAGARWGEYGWTPTGSVGQPYEGLGFFPDLTRPPPSLCNSPL